MKLNYIIFLMIIGFSLFVGLIIFDAYKTQNMCNDVAKNELSYTHPYCSVNLQTDECWCVNRVCVGRVCKDSVGEYFRVSRDNTQ